MNTRSRIAFVFVTICLMCSYFAHAEEIVPRDVPFAMPSIKVPAVPDWRASVSDYGGIGDGQSLNTQAFVNAIAACVKAGGGTVVVPSGTWLTGPIKLESNVNLHLQDGALIQFSKRIEDFPLIAGFDGTSRNYIITPPLHAYRATNVMITGNGVIDGAGEAWRYVKKSKQTAQQWKELVASGGVVSPDGNEWWPSKEAMGGAKYLDQLEESGRKPTVEDFRSVREYLRPDLVRFVQCDGVLIDGPVFRNSPKFHLHMVQSENIVIRNVMVMTPWYAQNGDGIDLAACRNVVISRATVDVGDDAICLKPSRVSSKQKAGPACENIVIENCTVFHGHGGFVIGSETWGGVNNILVRNCVFVGTDIGLRFKSMRGNGGLVSNVFIEGIRMSDIREEAILFDMYYNMKNAEMKEEPVTDRTPRFNHLSIKDVQCVGAKNALVVRGLPEMPLKDIRFENVHVRAEEGVSCSYAEQIVFQNVSLELSAGPSIALHDTRNITFAGLGIRGPSKPLLSVSGNRSDGIRFDALGANESSAGINVTSEVKAGAVNVGGKVFE